MTVAEARTLILDTLAEIAPEAASTDLDAERPLREQIDLDSMDFLSLITALSERIGTDIPERDYMALETLADAASYLSTAAAGDDGA